MFFQCRSQVTSLKYYNQDAIPYGTHVALQREREILVTSSYILINKVSNLTLDWILSG